MSQQFPEETSRYFSDQHFWQKVLQYAKMAGAQVIEKALWLYYAAQQPATPVWAKSVIYGALGYFILPLDAIPDLMPVAGYTDDLGVLVSALATVAMYVTDGVKAQAAKKMREWFGPS